jgi:putative flippase GtrA
MPAAPERPIVARALALAARHKHLIKYFFIGATASAIDVGVFLVLHNLAHTTPFFAHSVSVPTAVLFSFTVNSRHNFQISDHLVLRLLSFAAVAGIGYLVGLGVIEFARSSGLGANMGKFLSLPIVFALQYTLNSRITFYKKRPAPIAQAAGDAQ